MKGFILVLLMLQDPGGTQPDQMLVLGSFDNLSDCWAAFEDRHEPQGEAILACLPE